MVRKSFLSGILLVFSVLLSATASFAQAPPPLNQVKHVFIILMENQPFSNIQGNTAEAPYVNSLLGSTNPPVAYATNYLNLTDAGSDVSPSLPNYMWLEGGDDFGISNDANPPSNVQGVRTPHFTNQLDALVPAVQWRYFAENLPGGCPPGDSGDFVVHHVPIFYFQDYTNAGCTRTRNYTQLTSGLSSNTSCTSNAQTNCVAQYNFITPNCLDDGHGSGCGTENIAAGDSWLSNNVPLILASNLYKTDGMILIVWDESNHASTGQAIGAIVISPFAKAGGTSNVQLSHGSTLKTFQEIFGINPTTSPLGVVGKFESPSTSGTADLISLFQV